MVCSVGVRYPNEPSPENAKLLVKVGEGIRWWQWWCHGSEGKVVEEPWSKKKKGGFFGEKRMVFLWGGIIWLPGLYIFILCAVYFYRKNRYMSCMHMFFECLPLDATPRMRDVLFPCWCSRNETRAALDYIIAFFFLHRVTYWLVYRNPYNDILQYEYL